MTDNALYQDRVTVVVEESGEEKRYQLTVEQWAQILRDHESRSRDRARAQSAYRRARGSKDGDVAPICDTSSLSQNYGGLSVRPAHGGRSVKAVTVALRPVSV